MPAVYCKWAIADFARLANWITSLGDANEKRKTNRREEERVNRKGMTRAYQKKNRTMQSTEQEDTPFGHKDFCLSMSHKESENLLQKCPHDLQLLFENCTLLFLDASFKMQSK